MLGEFLYSLTPRDDQTLPLEIRDFRASGTMLAAGQALAIVFDPIPPGKIAIPLSASFEWVTGIAGLNINSGTIGVIVDGTRTVHFGGLRYSQPVSAPGISYRVSMWVPAQFIAVPSDMFEMQLVASAAPGVNVTVNAHVRTLLVARGNLGV